MKTLQDVKTFDELLEVKYGSIGTKKRDEFESRSQAFMIGELLKETRRNAQMTQEQLARKTGTKKSYISRVENGKIDIQLSTLYRIFELGLGRQITFSIL